MEWLVIALLNGVSFGLLLFLLSAGLTLTLSLMGILNFAHASFYMLGAYAAFSLSQWVGFFPAMIVAPLLVGLFGAWVEAFLRHRAKSKGHVPELLLTFGVAMLVTEGVQLVWGRGPVDYRIPDIFDGVFLSVYGHHFSNYRAFMMAISLSVAVAIWIARYRTRIGLLIQAARTHPDMLACLGHDVPRLLKWVFAGGAALAGLAGVIGGNAFVTEPNMAMAMGNLLFVVVIVGGLGSLIGAFWCALLIGVLQTMAVTVNVSALDVWQHLQVVMGQPTPGAVNAARWLTQPLSNYAPLVPYALLVAVIAWRPHGLWGSERQP